MDPCYPLVKTSSVSSALTVAHLIRNIEQLKNKDKLISQLEKDLGRQSWGAATHFAVLERRRSEGNPLPPGGLDLSHQFRTLPEGSDDPDNYPWTPTSIQSPEDVEDVWSNCGEGSPLGKQNLPNQLKGNKDHNKDYVEKCRSFLQQNKELTAQNRAFKDSNERATQEAKKSHELLEHSKLQMLQLNRQLSQLKAERSEWEQQMRSVEGLRQELMEDKKMINALRKACSDKDRRIELIQHRKKRRRMLESVEKAKIQSAGLKETPFGYEEDDKQQQQDGNQSVCSFSSTISDDSVWEEVLSKEEMEQNYQRLMLEQLELQKSHAMLQRQTDNLQDPQREQLSKADLQNDLFLSQCRIEQLEYFIREGLRENPDELASTRERMQAEIEKLSAQVKSLQNEKGRLQKELVNVQERNEDMEFRLIELEQFGEHIEKQEAQCPNTSLRQATSTPNLRTGELSLPPQTEDQARGVEKSQMMEQLAKELNALLKGKGRDAESTLKKMEGLIDQEKALQNMAHELQMKVIGLQQEKNSLQDRLLLVEQSRPGKGGSSVSLTEARERQENLALKAAIESQSQLVSERAHLQEQLKKLKAQNEAYSQQVNILTQQLQKGDQVQEEVIEQSIQPNLQAPLLTTELKDNSSTPVVSLSRKPSDRKSKSKDGDNPTVSKRRKNAADSDSDDSIERPFRKYRSVGNTNTLNDSRMAENNDTNETRTNTLIREDQEIINHKMAYLEQELCNMKKHNEDLIVQLQESMTKKIELECNHQSLQDQVCTMEQDLDLLHKENVALGDQLRQRVEEFQVSQDELNPTVSELEEYCEDLQERLRDTENSERRLSEKLKLYEKSIEEAETHEMTMRERCEQLLAGDYEAKKLIHDLQRTGVELRDILIEKEIVEQALREKVDFLQKAEAASVERIDELEGIVEDLRHQLDDRSDGKSQYQKEAHKITELKHQMTFLETDNKALSARVAELEENEETLRENWRRVADEDFNRTQCLEEKVRLLEGMNRDLKVKLKDAQEYLVVDMAEANLSLAAELAESEAKIFEDSSDDNDDDEDMRGMDDVDSSMVKQGSVDSPEKKSIREKVKKLERQLSDISEKKNSEIERLQGKLVDMKDMEIKLSETISEMEMTEREIRAKLALYESSEITVEKMLKYQSKIEELRTSQESLLDQLEIKENQEMTLQEKMQEMERTLRGKIVTLEVEMKGYKQRELKNAGQIRELEKKDNELSDKVAQQAEKENGLYVRISSLMDELKTNKMELETVRRQMEEKEDKVREAKMLEVKLLEMEMAHGKKVSTLDAKLRHREEEFRQKESSYEQEISTLKEAQNNRSQMEVEFAQKDHEMQQITNERHETISTLSLQISDLQKDLTDATKKMCSLESELESERQKVYEKENLIDNLNKEIESKMINLETRMVEKEVRHKKEMGSLHSEICLKEEQVSALEGELREMMHRIEQVESEKENNVHEETRVRVLELMSFCDNCICDIEKKVAVKLSLLETKLKTMQSYISDLQDFISEKCMKIWELEAEKDEQKKLFEETVLEVKHEKDVMESELENKISNLTSQLEQEKNKNESEESALLKESQEREASLSFDVSNLQHQVEQHKHELIAKLSELEAKNKAHCELSLDLTTLRHDYKMLQKDLDKSRQAHSDLKFSLNTIVTQKDDKLSQCDNKITQLNKVIEDLNIEVYEKGELIDKSSKEKHALISENDEQLKTLKNEKSDIEYKLSESSQKLDKVNQLLYKVQNELVETKKVIDDKDHIIQKHDQEKGEKEILLQETQSHVQSIQTNKDNMTQELQSVKSHLEHAQSQIQLQQQELQLLGNQLQTHQEETQTLKEGIKEKEELLQEKDQKYDQLSTELKNLHQDLQERNQKLEQAECKVADVEVKLKKAENRVRELESMHVSLEVRLEERYAVSQNAEEVLRSKQMQCEEMENKLTVAEKNVANLKNQLDVGNESSKELAQRFEARETELQEKQNEVSVLKENLNEREEMYSFLESKFEQLEIDLGSIESKCSAEKQSLELLVSEKDVIITSLETRLQKNDNEISDLTSKCDELDSKLKHVCYELDQKKCDFDKLQNQMEEKESKLSEYKAELNISEQELGNAQSKLHESEKVNAMKMAEVENMEKENQTLKQAMDKLSAEQNSFHSKEESLRLEMQSNENSNKTAVSQLESQVLESASTNESLQKENSVLNDKIQVIENELSVANQQRSDLNYGKQSLSTQLSEIQSENKTLLTRMNTMESDLEENKKEMDQVVLQATSLKTDNNRLKTENSHLQKEIKEAAKEFQDLTVSCEESKKNFEDQLHELSEGKQKVEKDFVALQKLHSYQTSELAKKLEGKVKEVNHLKEKCDQYNEENVILTSKVDLRKLELSQSLAIAEPANVESIIEDKMVCETDIKVSMTPSLFSVPSLGEVKSMTPNDDVDKGKSEQLLHLEHSLKETKEKESHLHKRVNELEIVEKYLREQIVDIEMTVIVPLETENQELKDEIGIVKQERDEAISKISKWDDDDESNEERVQESEAVHQRLEDALIFGEELERKNSILLSDIQKLENENVTLHERINDLEAIESENKDEIENLQEELNTLQEAKEEDTSVLEETETTLMDKVLDLEEKERSLIHELEQMKSQLSTTDKDLTEMEAMTEKMKYLEQKNQIFLDAEGQYMDKIMELEEDRHRLLSELSSYTDNVQSQTSQSHNIPHTSVNKDSVSSSTQTSVPFESNNSVAGALNMSDGVDSSYHSDTVSCSGQTHSSKEEIVEQISVLEGQLQESKVQIQNLVDQVKEKDTHVLYLQDKLELLQDSEGKLMDKLLEAEEKASATVYSKYSSEISELNKKIEQIQEENEFLAENVEQYKNRFKEEKEKCNDLQDKVIEDSTKLQKNREDLVETRQLLENIQSEYEEQLNEHVVQSDQLKDQLSLAVKELNSLEESLNEAKKREEELLEQVDSLKSTEKELRSRIVLIKNEDEDSTWSDSGLSADDPRVRTDPASLKEPAVVEAPIIHRSVKTVLLSTPSTRGGAKSPSNIENPDPIPAPRSRRKSRQLSIENISHEELVFLVEDLQDREAALKKRVSDLQAIDDPDLSLKVVELEAEKVHLEKRLREVEQYQTSDSAIVTGRVISEQEWISRHDGLDKGNSIGLSTTSTAMLEKPEDVLNQRIKDLEGLDKHNKNMLSELERDREALHEIARKDKATIHDLNVKIRELQLSERSLKEQVTNLEVSENSFFTKCEELEAIRVQLEDRIHELEIHERRLRELVRKLKLDEERWLSKSGGMENAVAELSANEAQLKRIVQTMEMQKGGLSERTEYLEARVRELESVEVTLLARIKEYENNEVILQNRLVQLENAEAAAHSRASELDMVNVNLAQQHKKMVDENSVMAQHLAQLHGQVQDLDRRLLSSRDSEIAYKQHVESLQKNESLLQKKVREFELREIDSQSSIRELEQTIEINSDKLSALQRSENRLRYRVQELEGVGGHIPGELTPSQQQMVPQKIEDCQKRVVLLQGQVENLKLQLRQALNTTQQQSANKSESDEVDKSNNVSISGDEYSQLHAKAVLLDEYAYQNEELESNQEQLRDTILQLRQGKGACGHEVEIEVYKRRMESLQTFISKLKSSLSEGQTTSLLDSDQDSGPQGETLPARHLQVLESERVLQSVRGLHHNGKADTSTTNNGGVHTTGLAQMEDSMIQAEAIQNMAALPSSAVPEQSYRREESHWKAIEARKPVTNVAANDSRGGVNTAHGRENSSVSSSPRHDGNQRNSTADLEDVTGVLNLQSESELSSYHRTTQNDTDSCSSPIPPPRKNRANRLSKNMSDDNSSSNNGSGSERDHYQGSTSASKAAANQRHFDNGESLPLTASNIERQFSSPQRNSASLSRFAEDSFYLPSSTQEGVDSLDDDESPPPLPSQGPPGQDMAPLSSRSSRASSANMQEGRKESLDNSTSGMSIRERIAFIEKHLQSDTHTGSQSNRDEEDQLFYWKRKSTEGLRQIESLDKNNKFLKEDINRLEKELEEKRRHMNTLELWLSSTEELLKNKNKQTDREMIEKLQLDLTKLRQELGQSGYNIENTVLDAAALKTELEHKDREITSKRVEIDALSQELRRCHKECRSIEGMRRTALDSLRSLERELLYFQDSEEKLKKAQAEINTFKIQYENKRMDLNTIISEKDELEFGMSKLILERDSFKIDLQKAEKDREALQKEVEDLKERLEDLCRVDDRNSKLEEELKSLNSLLVQRNEKIKEVYEENLNLRDGVNKSEAELTRFRTICDDFNNLSARYDELDQFKNQAMAMVQPLQIEVEKLKKKCREKDVLLRRLGAELRRGVQRPSSVLDQLTRLERAMNGEEYNTDNSDNLSDDLSPRLSDDRFRGRSVSMDELSLYSDTDSLQGPLTAPNHSPTKRQRPTPYVNSRPRSAEAGSSNPRNPRRMLESSSHPRQSGQRSLSQHPPHGFDLNHEHFVAIADYDPGLWSQSGRLKLELALREGDEVRVTGPMDRLGYCEAESNGRTGLVPANYLQPLHYGDMNGHSPPSSGHHQPSPIIHLDRGVEPPLEFLDQSLHHINSIGNSPRMSVKPVRSYHSVGILTLPDPPSNLHVRGIQDGCLVLAWKPPQMDAKGCNKGMQVIGYMVYVNNQEYEHIPNPQMCKVALQRLEPSTRHLFAVQSVCVGDLRSPRTELVFEGMVRLDDGEGDGQDGPLDTDLSSVLNSVHYTKGMKKKVMALYEYNPEDQSPHDYTSFELAFHAGDVLAVYGDPRSDGFYHGEMEGRRGLVPACFVEDLAISLRRGKHGSEDSGHESSKV